MPSQNIRRAGAPAVQPNSLMMSVVSKSSAYTGSKKEKLP